MFSAETPSQSNSDEKFHFSLPKDAEPLKPVTCNTPPAVVQPFIPETQESHPKERMEGPVVCETPGMSTQGQNAIPMSSYIVYNNLISTMSQAYSKFNMTHS